MCSLFIKQICVIFFCASRAASLQFGVIFMHVNTRIILFSRRKLQLCDATIWEEENRKYKRKRGIKIIIKTHTHCQGRRSTECRPHHHNRIGANVNCLCWCIAERWNVSFGSRKKIFQLSNQIEIHLNFYEREEILKCKTVTQKQFRFTIWRSRLSLIFHYHEEYWRRTFREVSDLVAKL